MPNVTCSKSTEGVAKNQDHFGANFKLFSKHNLAVY